MPELSPDEMGGALWAKQAAARAHAEDTFDFPDAAGAKPKPAPEKAAKGKAKK